MWGTDYPHPEGLWPRTVERNLENFRGVPDAELSAIFGHNAIGVYGFDAAALSTIAARIGPEKSAFAAS